MSSRPRRRSHDESAARKRAKAHVSSDSSDVEEESDVDYHGSELEKQDEIRMKDMEIADLKDEIAKLKDGAVDDEDSKPAARSPNLRLLPTNQVPRRVKKKTKTGREKKEPPTTDENYGPIRDMVRLLVFPVSKFLNKIKLKKASAVVAKGFFGDDATEKVLDNFYQEHGNAVRVAHNDVRNYGQQQVTNFIVKLRMDEGNVFCPNADDVIKCISRDQEFLNTDEGKECFDFMVDVLLPKVCGAGVWLPNYRYTATISAATHAVSNKPCITPSTEAFLGLMFEGCDQRWDFMAECKANGNEIDRNDERYNNPYNDHEAGNAPFGGYTKEGQERFKELLQLVEAGRSSPHCAQVEAECLARLQAARPNGAADDGAEDADESDGEDEFGF